MKKIALLILVVLSVSFSYGQGIAYQATILSPETLLPGHNSELIPLANTQICLEFSFFDHNQQLEYSESQQITTSEFGRIDLIIGTGSPLQSSFDQIDWNGKEKTLQIRIDYTGSCSNFEDFSINQFQYTPYAFYASEAGNSIDVMPNLSQVLSSGNDAAGATITGLATPVQPQDAATKAYVDNAVPPNTSLVNNGDGTFTFINEAGTSTDIDIMKSKIVDNGDGTYDLTDDFGTTITIDLNKVIVSADTTNLLGKGTDGGAYIGSVDDADNDPANELQTLAAVLATDNDANGLAIENLLDPTDDQDAATKKYVDDNDAVDDADSDPENEKSDLVFDAATNQLSLSNPTTVNNSVDLSKYLDDQTLAEILSIETSAGNSKITKLVDPTDDQDAATKKYVDDNDAVDDADSDPANELQTLAEVLATDNDANGLAIENLLDPTNDQDAATKKYVDDNDAVDDADNDPANELQTLAAVLATDNDANGLAIENLLDPTNDQDAATKKYVDDNDAVDDADNDPANELQTLAEVLATDNDANGLAIENLLDPTNDQDAATKKYVDDNDAVDDADNDPANELQTLAEVLATDNDANGLAIENLLDPTNDQDAATKKYVDGVIKRTTVVDNLNGSYDLTDDFGTSVFIDTRETTTTLSPGSETGVFNYTNEGGWTSAFDIRVGTVSEISTGVYSITDDFGTNITVDTSLRQNLKLDDDELSITGSSSPSIDLSIYKNQSMSLSNITHQLDLVDGTGTVSVSLIDYVNNDTNELQTLAEVLATDNDANGLAIENLLDPTNDQDAATKKYVDDNNTDSDPANEIQDLNINNNSLSITDNISATIIDLSGFKNKTMTYSSTTSILSLESADSSVVSTTIPNMYNQTLDIVGNELQLTDGTGTLSVTLASLNGFMKFTELVGDSAPYEIGLDPTNISNKKYFIGDVDVLIVSTGHPRIRLNNLDSNFNGKIITIVEKSNEDPNIYVQNITGGYDELTNLYYNFSTYESIQFIWYYGQWYPMR